MTHSRHPFIVNCTVLLSPVSDPPSTIRLKRFCFLLLVFLIGLGCQSDTSQNTIGVIAPLTGDAAKFGTDLQRGAQLAASALNDTLSEEQGINLRFEDSEADPKAALSAYNKLSSESVDMIIGGMFSNTTLAFAPIAQREDMTVLSPTASDPQVPNTGNHIFTIYPSSTQDGKFLAGVVAESLKVSSVAVVYVQDNTMTSVQEVFKDQVKKRGLRVVGSEQIERGTSNFRTVITKLETQNPDAVFLATYLPEIARFLNQADNLSFNPQVITISTGYNEKLFKLTNKKSDGLILTAPYFEGEGRQKVRKIREKYAKRYNDDLSIWSAYGYDSVILASKAIIRREGNKDIKKALRVVKGNNTITRFEEFTKGGQPKTSLTLIRVKNKQFIKF